MNLINRFAQREFSSYEDFDKNFKINVPKNFNYGFDVIDEYARLCPGQRALLWCDDKGAEKTFSFGDISRLSNKAAQAFLKNGIKKGDTVLLMLKRRCQCLFSRVRTCQYRESFSVISPAA